MRELVEMNKYKGLLIKICIIICIELLFLVFGRNTYISLLGFSEEEYFLDKGNYARTELGVEEALDVDLEGLFDRLLRIKIPLIESVGDIAINYQVTDADGNVVIEGVQTAEELSANGALIIQNESNLIKGKTSYKLNIHLVSGEKVVFEIAADGTPKMWEYYDTSFLASGAKSFIIICAGIIAILCVFLMSRSKLEYKYLVVSLVLGIIMCFITIPCSVPDEWRHFLRAYDIANGNFVTTKIVEVRNVAQQQSGACDIPKELATIKDMGRVKSVVWTDESNNKLCIAKWISGLGTEEVSGETVEFPTLGTCEKSIVEYFPQVLFIVLAKCLGMSSLWIFYFARLGSLLFSIILLWVAIRLIPKNKALLMGVSLIPEYVLLRSSCSTDGYLFGAMMLFFAIVLFLKENRKNIFKTPYIVLLLVLCGYIAVLKLPYFLIALTLLMLDKEQFSISGLANFKRKNEVCKTLFVFIFVLISFLLYNVTRVLFAMEGTATVASGSFAGYVLTHIKDCVAIVVFDTYENLQGYLIDGLIWPLDNIMALIIIVCLVGIAVTEDGFVFPPRQKAWFILLIVAMWYAIVAAMMSVSDLPSGTIWGLQGRYATPLIALAMFAFTKRTVNNKIVSNVFTCGLFAANILFGIDMFSRYWI